MQTSENLDAFLPAFISVQQEVYKVVKDKDNPFHRSKYADLQAVAEAVYPALHKNKLVVLQGFDENAREGELIVVTKLMHVSSQQWIESRMPIPSKQDKEGGFNPQGHGSAATYGRRYSLMAILGLVAVAEDDDGEQAMGPYRKQQQSKPRQAAPRQAPPAQQAPPRQAPAQQQAPATQAPQAAPAQPAASGDVNPGDPCPGCGVKKLSQPVINYCVDTLKIAPRCIDCQKKASAQ